MKIGFAVLGCVLLLAFSAAAQDVPKMEVFAGYTYTRVNSATNVPAFSANGGGGQFVYNFNSWLSGVADIGAVHNGDIGGFQLDNTWTNFVFGPRISLRYSRLRPYVHTLFGGVYGTASTALNLRDIERPTNPIFLPGVGTIDDLPSQGEAVSARLTTSQTAFAMMIGGGLDIKINKHLSFRPVGLDWYMPRLQNLRTQGDNNQHCLRYTTGVNFTFGAR
jgi:hypothetical protein